MKINYLTLFYTSYCTCMIYIHRRLHEFHQLLLHFIPDQKKNLLWIHVHRAILLSVEEANNYYDMVGTQHDFFS